MPDFRSFRVLLDKPAANPALGFDDYAQAFADVILHSDPRFAIGIFGDWGSGKTTLMEAIKRELAPSDAVIPVWFNAWRYEREEHLIVPLLDTLREGLAKWALKREDGSEERSQARRAAATVGRAAKALLAGLTVRATVGVADVELDPKSVMDSWQDDERLADDPISFYHASFNAMKGAIGDFVDGSDRRVVIFIDDLDRCLPHSALEVLESMKLFFDLEGFVFVVGLDQKVIEQSIELKYQGAVPVTEPANAANDRGEGVGPVVRSAGSISGTDYVKKIFQVPFGLPRISTGDLRPFFDALVAGGKLPREQQDELNGVVWAHLESATGADAGSVNPREVKRLINAYTLQMKMLSAKLADPPNPNVVLAIQTMTFRSDWRELYDLLAADPELFVQAVRRVLDDSQGRTEFFLRNEPLPPAFLAYLRGPGAPLLEELSLDIYITSAETTGSSDPRVAEARTIVAQAQRILHRLGEASGQTEREAVSDLSSRFGKLHELVQHRSAAPSYFASEAERLARTLRDEMKKIASPSPDPLDQTPSWAPKVLELLVKLDENLRELRRETHVGAVAA
jgi:KAP family P-loop domain